MSETQLIHYIARATREVMERQERFSFDDVRTLLASWDVSWDNPCELSGGFTKLVLSLQRKGRLTMVGYSRSTIPASRSRKLKVYKVNW
jgi:hypothetical protein